MVSSKIRKMVERRALTLIELIVVLVILIGLAGILMPLVPTMLGKTETASGATNVSEIYKWVQTYQLLYAGFPADLDALVDGAGAEAFKVRGGADVAIDAGLTAAEADAINGAGLTRVQLMLSAAGTDPWDPTFNPYTSADRTTAGSGLVPATGSQFLTLTGTGQQKLNLSDNGVSTGKFVVFGFGKRSGFVGKVAADAPITFRDDGAKTPDQVYCRYGLVFQVGTLTTTFERARFVGVCDFRGDGIHVLSDLIEEWYELNKGGA